MPKKIICHDSPGKLYKVDNKDLMWRPSVYGLLFDGDKILLSRQWDGYDFPGGGININETVEEGLMREFWEETGLKIRIGKVFYINTSFFKPSSRNEFWNSILIYYLCYKKSGKLNINNADEEEKKYIGLPEWVDIKDIKKIKFYNSSDNKDIIKKGYELVK
jgi:ADP-ribose pyrophosphatase YjhB (NUDIX family)